MPTPPTGWKEKDGSLQKTFEFKTFPAAISFMMEVALFCEKSDHHPNWTNSFNKVEVSLKTHDADAITEKDRCLADHMDKVFDHGSDR
jgi:4a-hydroxytetrahydrobiopterin dehydratase